MALSASPRTDSNAPDSRPNVGRRDFLMISATTLPLVGTAFAMWPFLSQMLPDANALALANTEVDLKAVAPGQAITVLWRGKPVFVRRRTPQELETVKAVPVADLLDPYARNPALPEGAPATDANRTKPGHEEWIVVVGICTHLGCIPQGQTPLQARGDWGGWFCSCHGSQYDTAGRVRKRPAPANLDVPPYFFVTDTRIMIGPLEPPTPAA